eukprot:scaffold5277_cov404-Prasinococcus_capsulatus_cf.AAC.11
MQGVRVEVHFDCWVAARVNDLACVNLADFALACHDRKAPAGVGGAQLPRVGTQLRRGHGLGELERVGRGQGLEHGVSCRWGVGRGVETKEVK